MIWSAPQRVVFRFTTLVAVMLIAPFPARFVPGGMAIDDAVERAWDVGVAWYAETILGIGAPPIMRMGSGDTLWHFVQLALIASLASIGTIVWSALDHRRQNYTRAASAMHVLLRFFVGTTIILYGVAKIWPMQMPPLSLSRYDTTLGEMSPMGLLWTFMGHSQPYTIITGLLEVLAGTLLFWRRTTLFGAALALVCMTQIVLLNLSYDVPVKLFSMQLLAMSFAIALPYARRMIAAALGHATPPLMPRIRGSRRVELARVIAKWALLVAMVAQYAFVIAWVKDHRPPPTALHGAWRVERHVRDGVDVPPLFTDDTRLRRVVFDEYGATLRFATDRRARYRVRVTNTTVIIVGIRSYELAYTRTADRMILEGTLYDHQVRLELALEPPPPLATRGFHWVQDVPYHR